DEGAVKWRLETPFNGTFVSDLRHYQNQVIDVPTATANAVPMIFNDEFAQTFNRQQMFADRMMLAFDLQTSIGGTNFDADPAFLDDNGYPTELAPGFDDYNTLFAWDNVGTIGPSHYTDPADASTRYVLRWDGDATFSLEFGASNIDMSNAANGEIQFDWLTNQKVRVRWVPTPGNPAVNIRLHMERHRALIDERGRQALHPDFERIFANCDTFRVMQGHQTNNSFRRTAAGFKPLGSFSVNKAMWIDVCCAVANQLNTDLWYTFHHDLTDATITQIAEIARDQLAPHLNFLIELSNEVWNPNFGQQTYVVEQSIADRARTLADQQGTVRIDNDTRRVFGMGTNFTAFSGSTQNGILVTDDAGNERALFITNIVSDTIMDLPAKYFGPGVTDATFKRTEAARENWYAKGFVRMTQLVVAAFGAQANRVRPLLMWHQQNPDNLRDILWPTVWAAFDPDGYVDPKTLVWAVGTSTYVGNKLEQNEAIWDELVALADNVAAGTQTQDEFNTRFAEVVRDRTRQISIHEAFKRLQQYDAIRQEASTEAGRYIRLICYEGPLHYFIQLPAEYGNISQAIHAYIRSDFGADDVETIWRAVQTYSDGGFVQFVPIRPRTRDGTFAAMGHHSDDVPANAYWQRLLTLSAEGPWYRPQDPPIVVPAAPSPLHDLRDPIELTTADTGVDVRDIRPLFSAGVDAFQVVDPQGGATLSGSQLQFDTSAPSPQRNIQVSASKAGIPTAETLAIPAIVAQFVKPEWWTLPGALAGWRNDDPAGAGITLDGIRVDRVDDAVDPAEGFVPSGGVASRRPFYDAQAAGADAVTRTFFRFAGEQHMLHTDGAIATSITNEFLIDFVGRKDFETTMYCVLGARGTPGSIEIRQTGGNLQFQAQTAAASATISIPIVDGHPLMGLHFYLRNGRMGAGRNGFTSAEVNLAGTFDWSGGAQLRIGSRETGSNRLTGEMADFKLFNQVPADLGLDIRRGNAENYGVIV
ncbi:MAG: hypothetical protein AAFR17_06435, partial [Pseudomonadota bacterium]